MDIVDSVGANTAAHARAVQANPKSKFFIIIFAIHVWRYD